jgi:hypothetical protein
VLPFFFPPLFWKLPKRDVAADFAVAVVAQQARHDFPQWSSLWRSRPLPQILRGPTMSSARA